MPRGDIKGYDELIDVGNNFNPSTGVFTVGNKEEEEGTYVFLFSGRKDSFYGKAGDIDVYKNGNWVQSNYESDVSHDLEMNSMVSFNLKRGDEIWLNNGRYYSIEVGSTKPLTFIGYKL